MSIQDLIKNSTPRDKKPQPAPAPQATSVPPVTQPQPQKKTTEELFPTYTALTQSAPREEQVQKLTPFKRFALGVYETGQKIKDITKGLPGAAQELGVKKSLTSVATGITRATASIPDVVVGIGGTIERAVQQKIKQSPTVRAVRASVEKVSPEYAQLIDRAIEKTVKTPDIIRNPAEVLADSIKEWGEEKATQAESFVDFTEEDKMNSFNQLMQSGGQMVPIMLPGLGASSLLIKLRAMPSIASITGMTISSALEAGMESQDVYDTVLSETNDKEKAERAADGTFFANVALNIVTNKMSGLFDESPGLLKRQVYAQYAKNPSNVTQGILAVANMTKATAQGYVGEGIQESAQQIISNVATGRPWASGVPESFALGGITGGAFGLGGSVLGTYTGSDRVMGTGPGVDAQATTAQDTETVDNLGTSEDTETQQIIAQLPKEGTVDYNALAEDVAVLLQTETPETVEKALDFGYGLTREQAQQVIASAEVINNRFRQQQEIVEQESLAQMDISSRLSQTALLQKIKDLDATIETKTAKDAADAINLYFNPKTLTPEERLDIAQRIANTPVATRIIEEYTGTVIKTAQDALEFMQVESDFFRENATADIIGSLDAAMGAGATFNERTNEYRRFASGLPSWIPEEFRQVAFVKKVAQYFKKGSLPPARATREQELYDIIKKQIDAQAQYYKEERTFKVSDLPDDIAFNVQSAVNIDSNIITNDEALSAVREYFTAEEVPVVFVEKIKTARGMEAWGAYSNGVIRLANNTSKDTPHHEAVHAFLDLFIAPQKKRLYLDESIKTYRKMHGEIETQKKIAKIQNMYGETMSLREATDIFAEEALADGFFEYLKAQKKKQPAPNAISQILQDFYQAVIDFIDTIVNPNSAKKLYRDLVNRKRVNRKAKDASIRKFVNEYERFYAGQDVSIPLVSTKAFTQDGDTIRYYSSPTRMKKRGNIQLRRVKDDNGAYIDSFVVTSGSDVIGTFQDVQEAELFAEQMRAQKDVPSIQFGAVTSRIENGVYMILDVKGNAQRLVQEEINIAMANDNTLTVVIPKKYLRGVDIDSLGITVAQDDKTVTIQPTVSQNVQMYKEKIEDAYVGVAPSVLPVIGREDILVMKDFINSVEIGEEITKDEFQMAEKIAEALDISMDRGLGKVKQYFVETLQGKRQIPQKARELFSVKEDAVDPLFEEAKKYKSVEEFVKAKSVPEQLSYLEKQASGVSYETFKRNLVKNIGSVERGEKISDDVAQSVFERLQKTAQRGEFGDEATLFKDMGGRNPKRLVGDETITVYRATPVNKLRAGDFVSPDKTEAGFYTSETKKIYPFQIKKSDLVSMDGSMGGGQELIYIPKGSKQGVAVEFFKSPKEFFDAVNSKSQLEDIWKQANKQGGEMFNVKEDGKRGLSPEFQKKWESFLVVNGKLQSFGETKTILNDAKPVEPITTTRVNKESRLYKRIKQDISTLTDTPEYGSTTIESEDAKALMLAEMVQNDPSKLKKIVQGQEKKPDDISIMAIGKVAWRQAQEKGDHKEASKILTSMTIKASEFGSEISMLQNMDPHDSDYWIMRVLRKKKELIEKQYKISFVEKLKSEKQQTRKEINKAFKEEMTKFENEIDAFFNKITC